MELEVIKGGIAPVYGTELSSGLDLFAVSLKKVYKGDKEINPESLKKLQDIFEARGEVCLRRGERALFGTGIVVRDCQHFLEGQIRPRSGNSLKRGLLTVHGTIDADYRGELGVSIINTTGGLSKVFAKEKIAQLVISSVFRLETIMVEDKYTPIEVIKKERGEGGFGHTGN